MDSTHNLVVFGVIVGIAVVVYLGRYLLGSIDQWNEEREARHRDQGD